MKPTIKRGPASPSAGPYEIINEVFSRRSKLGCLLSIRDTDGKLIIEVYCADPGVVVRAGGRDTPAEVTQDEERNTNAHQCP